MRWPQPTPSVERRTLNALWFMNRYLSQGTQLASRGSLASVVWPAANRAIYLPYELDRAMTVTELWVFNGAAASTGNWDMGIYTADGTRLVSIGSTAQTGGPGLIQKFNIADTLLGRGVFYLALAASSGATSVYGLTTGAANDYLLWGALLQAAAFPLPVTATFASNQTALVPACGLTGTLI